LDGRVEYGDCSDRIQVGWRHKKRQGTVFDCEIMAQHFACGAGMNSTEAVITDRWKIWNSEVGAKKVKKRDWTKLFCDTSGQPKRHDGTHYTKAGLFSKCKKKG